MKEIKIKKKRNIEVKKKENRHSKLNPGSKILNLLLQHEIQFYRKFISANRITSTLSCGTQVPSTGRKTLIANSADNSQFPLDPLWAAQPNEFFPPLCSFFFFGKHIMDEVQKQSKPTKNVSLFQMDEIKFS
jgi:hypothetical protein